MPPSDPAPSWASTGTPPYSKGGPDEPPATGGTSGTGPAPYAAPYGTSYGSSYGSPAPPYGSYGYGAPAPTAQRTNGKAIASFVLALVGLLLIPLIPSIIAVILGHSARNEIHNDPNQTGGGLAMAGLVIGWISIGLTLIAAFVFFMILAAFASGF